MVIILYANSKFCDLTGIMQRLYNICYVILVYYAMHCETYVLVLFCTPS